MQMTSNYIFWKLLFQQIFGFNVFILDLKMQKVFSTFNPFNQKYASILIVFSDSDDNTLRPFGITFFSRLMCIMLGGEEQKYAVTTERQRILIL